MDFITARISGEIAKKVRLMHEADVQSFNGLGVDVPKVEALIYRAERAWVNGEAIDKTPTTLAELLYASFVLVTRNEENDLEDEFREMQVRLMKIPVA